MALTKVTFSMIEGAAVNVLDYGAIGDGVTDDTSAIQAAIDYTTVNGGVVYFPAGVYRGKEIVLKSGVTLQGESSLSSKIRFFAEDPATDATKYCILWTGSYSAINNLTIDGQNPNISGNPKSVGNGVLISADSRGFHRKFSNSVVQFFAGYLASPIGGSYGINANYAADDIRDPITLGHKLTGGNCIKIDNVGSGSELVMNNMELGRCDGYGFEEGFNNDCKYENIYIVSCIRAGLSNTRSTSNTQYLNFKVYTCRALNVTDLQRDLIIPYTGQQVDTDAAIIITGTRHELTNIEAQENGSNGFRLGTVSRPLYNSNLTVIADGNGGIDSSASSTVNDDYKRDGIVLSNYYNVNINLIADDFRASLGLGRQKRGIRILALNTYSSGSTIYWGAPYYISDNSGGANFIPLQYGYASPSNTVGTIFYVSGPDFTVPSFTWGSGTLQSVNTALNLVAIIQNQTEQRDGTSTGYSISNDRGIDSVICINGIQLDNIAMNSGAWNEAHIVMGTYHLWVSASGKLYIKNGAPASDTDGTVVGTQT